MARGSVQKRTGAQGVSYRVRVEYDPDPVTNKRKQRSETFYTKREADKRLSEWMQEIERGVAVDPSTMTLGEFLTFWLDSVAVRTVRATTLEGYRFTIDKHLIPGLGSIKLQALKPAMIDGFYAKKTAAGVGDRTLELCHLRLTQALKQAVQWQAISSNPADRAKKPTAESKKGNSLTEDQAVQFLRVAESAAYSPLWLVALETGARQGELLALTWDDIDFDADPKTISINKAQAVLKSKLIVQAPKTKNANRTLYPPDLVFKALRVHRDRQRFQQAAAGEAWSDTGLVFTTELGTPIHPSDVLRVLYRMLNGLVFKKHSGREGNDDPGLVASGFPRIRFHDLRHTHGSIRLANGDDIAVVSRDLGHAKISITQDVYQHVLDNRVAVRRASITARKSLAAVGD